MAIKKAEPKKKDEAPSTVVTPPKPAQPLTRSEKLFAFFRERGYERTPRK